MRRLAPGALQFRLQLLATGRGAELALEARGLVQTLILHGLQPASTALGTELTSPIQAALESLANAVEADLRAWGYATP